MENNLLNFYVFYVHVKVAKVNPDCTYPLSVLQSPSRCMGADMQHGSGWDSKIISTTRNKK